MIEDKARERRRGLLINITGNGKGKTTAALGLSLRALGWGWRIEFLQFIKNDGDTGEKHFADAYGDNFVLTPLGAGFSWRPNASEVNDARAAADAWRLASEKILSGGSDMLVLDELNIAISRKHVSAAEVIETLKNARHGCTWSSPDATPFRRSSPPQTWSPKSMKSNTLSGKGSRLKKE